MSSQGVRLGQAIREIRAVLADIAHLLQQADAAVAGRGWRPTEGKSDVVWHSRSIHLPGQWFPSYVMRSYSNPAKPKMQVVLSVLLGESQDGDTVDEPLVTATWCEYEAGEVNWGHVRRELAYLHRHMKLAADGEPVTVSDEAQRYLEERGVKKVVRGETMALPLVEITDRKVLWEKLIDPVLQSVDQRPE